jgi:hypothetical protein
MEQKVNKKAIAGILAAMVLSLGVLSGISKQKSYEAGTQQAAVLICYALAEQGLDNLSNAEVGLTLALYSGLVGGPAGFAIGL